MYVAPLQHVVLTICASLAVALPYLKKGLFFGERRTSGSALVEDQRPSFVCPRSIGWGKKEDSDWPGSGSSYLKRMPSAAMMRAKICA